MYIFHTDPGHGWLEVNRSELRRLNLLDDITECSYQKGDKVFLEEDCDATRFIEAKKQAKEPFIFEEKYEDDSPIREYRFFER